MKGEEAQVLSDIDSLGLFRVTVQNKAPEIDTALELARNLLANAHPRAEASMANITRTLAWQWESLEQLLAEKEDKIKTVILLFKKAICLFHR